MRNVFQEILGELLDQGQITQARRLSQLFGISTKDLDIVLVRISMVRILNTVYYIDTRLVSLLAYIQIRQAKKYA